MEKEQRTRLQKATQDARKLLEEEFRSQLLQTYDIDVDRVRWAEEPGAHLLAEQRLIREKLIAWIEHKEAQINDRKEALLLALREMAFTALNRFVALKLMEARELVRPCVSGGLESAGFLEFTAVAQGLLADQESSYRLFLETIFEDVSRELRALFDPRDPASLLWPKRAALLELLEILNRPELSELWGEDETLGWVYQYFNGDAERKKMREESSAPRNSRELAVRNQFFTPRYVVEFLTDNTLGRIWYEMRQGNTGLKDRCRYLVRRSNEIWLQPGEEPPAQLDTEEALSQEELLRQPLHIPHRELKDPREIRMLDPACGSMHFGLYAFDLFYQIYAESWEMAQWPQDQTIQSHGFAGFVTYTAEFDDKKAFMREVPRLILSCNIYGVDIDTRASQIARLTLWLRAQRAWQDQRLSGADRLPISRSNVVCAEPMPGEKALLSDFIDQSFPVDEQKAFSFLLETVFDYMLLASEAGSLLRIEELIRNTIEEAKRLWKAGPQYAQPGFFGDELPSIEQAGLNLDLSGITDSQFWEHAERRIYFALQSYAERVEDGSGFRRRLFVEDAAEGFAFIDICRKNYDVALMNPPFGSFSRTWSSQSKIAYPISSNDILASFVERGVELLGKQGLIGAITSRTAFFLSSFAKWRQDILLKRALPYLFADIGLGVMDEALVEAAAYCLQKEHLSSGAAESIFIRVLEELDDKNAALIKGLPVARGAGSGRVYVVKPGRFSEISGSPFAYWISEDIRNLFRGLAAFEASGYTARTGITTSSDFRFLRLGWECRIGESAFKGFAKGGAYSPYYGDIYLRLQWRSNGHELKAFALTTPGTTHWSRYIRSPESYFRPGMTWSCRTKSELSMRMLPADCIFSHKGPAVFAEYDDPEMLLSALAIVNSKVFRYLLSVQLAAADAKAGGAARSYEVGLIQQTPFPSISSVIRARLAQLANKAWANRRTVNVSEEAHAFIAPAAEISSHTTIASLVERDILIAAESKKEYLLTQAEIDDICFDIYNISGSDRRHIEEVGGDNFVRGLDSETDVAELEQDEDGFDTSANSAIHVPQALISWFVGVLFGRWDVRFGTGEVPWPEVSSPIEPLPLLPLGMLKGSDGFPMSREEADGLRAVGSYPVDIAWSGILVDDPGSQGDLIRSLESLISSIWGGNSPRVIQEFHDLLRVDSLRDWFRSPINFFASHLRCYSKSRRQAPVYWWIAAGSGNYSIWLYYHRFTKDTLYRVLRDFIEPRIQQAEREQFELESQGALSGDAAVRLQEAQTLLQDLRILKSELDLIAPLWNPNLNDGVIINHAILWRITPYTPWQKKCKECWDKLVKGDYDWAHLSFHLWPERVIPNCTTDRSLAIAHGLEERLWQETNNGNWLPRQLSEAELQALISEHTKPAVKNALERFLAAPPPVASTRTRAPRATRSTSSGATRKPRGSATVVDAEASRQTLLALTAAPAEGLGRNAIAELLGVEAASLTTVIKQLKEGGQIEQLGAARGARYVLSEEGRARLNQEEAT